MRLVTLVGFAGSGKDSAAKHLTNAFAYRSHSFAESLKDTLATIFVWDRALLEGVTPESRRWRDTVDEWWAERLGIPKFTPRFAMQNIGTDVLRARFNGDLWTLNIARKLARYGVHDRVVLVDGRFPNELALTRDLGGLVVRIRRGPEPEWFEIARNANAGDPLAPLQMSCFGVHISEWAWIGQPFDVTIENDGTVEELHAAIQRTII